MRLHVPVASQARTSAMQVFQHFRDAVPPRREGLAYRRPWLIVGWRLAITLLCAIAGGIGWLLTEQGWREEAVQVLTIGGIMGALGGAFFTVVVTLATQPSRRR
jgi:hypothetical protein